MAISTWAMLALLSTGLGATDYHVAPSPMGNDANPGTTTGAPLATIAAALGKAASGDRVLLQRGGTFRGTFTLPAGRTLGAYGSGALPVVTASTVVAMGGAAAIKTASVATQVRAVWVNGAFVPLARYPDSGWLTCDSGSTSGTLIDSGISGRGAGRSTGAQVRWRRWSWWWETRPITGDNGSGQLTLGGTAQVDADLVGIGSGYFIDNDLDELDSPGEWFWGGGTLHLYPPAGVDPATMTVEVVTTTSGITTNGGTCENVAFQRFGGTALTLGGPTAVRTCDFREIEINAIDGSWNAFGSLITGCTFRDVRNTAIQWNENPAAAGGTVIERSRFERIGMQYGYGGDGSWHASGIILSNAKAVTIRLNRFIEVGYCGIILGSDGQTVENNVFVRCMGSLNDGAAIYTNCDASVIRGNIILDTIGNLSTSHAWTPLGHGIWPEFLSDFRDSVISDNTIYGNHGNGIFLPNNYTCTVSGNTCLDNRMGGLHLERGDNSKPANQNHALAGNILGVVSPTRRQSWTENLAVWSNPLASALAYETGIDYGTMSGTTFVVPAGQGLARTTGGTVQTMAQWQAANGSWAGSATHVASHPILLFNDGETAADITVPAGSWTHLDGTAVGATVNVAAFRSVVLVTTGTPPASPPYHAASGTDYRQPLTTPVTPTAPVITTHPADRTVTAPAAPGMTVAASGTAPFTYQWQRQPPGGGSWSAVGGATAPVLGGTSAVADSGAAYRCVVGNAAGSATSDPAVLTVLPAPAGGGGGGGDGGGGGGCGLGSGIAALAMVLFSLSRLWAGRGWRRQRGT
jgi:parallel beta-helix repeat protein